MSCQITLNIASMRKHTTGSFTSQVIVSYPDDTQSFYACHIYKNSSLDPKNIYQFNSGKWELVTLDADVVAKIKTLMVSVIRRTAHLYKREITSANQETRLAMFSDAVINFAGAGSTSGHALKIGDRVFKTFDPYDLTMPRSKQKTIEFEMLGAPGVRGQVDLNDDPRLLARIEKQFEYACKLRSRELSNRPVGGGSWADVQNDRKAFGNSTMNHRQLQRSRS